MPTPASTPVTRRRVVQGIAWSTPAIAATVAAPAHAASTPCDPAVTWSEFFLEDPGVASLSYDDATNMWTLSGTAPTYSRDEDDTSFNQFGYWRYIYYKDGTYIQLGEEPNPQNSEVGPELITSIGEGDSFSYTAQGAGPLADVEAIDFGSYEVVFKTPGSTFGLWNKGGYLLEISPDGCDLGGPPQEPTCTPSITWNFALYEGLNIPLPEGFNATLTISHSYQKVVVDVKFADGFASSPDDPATITVSGYDHEGTDFEPVVLTGTGTGTIPIRYTEYLDHIQVQTTGTSADGTQDYTSNVQVRVDEESCTVVIEPLIPHG